MSISPYWDDAHYCCNDCEKTIIQEDLQDKILNTFCRCPSCNGSLNVYASTGDWNYALIRKYVHEVEKGDLILLSRTMKSHEVLNVNDTNEKTKLALKGHGVISVSKNEWVDVVNGTWNDGDTPWIYPDKSVKIIRHVSPQKEDSEQNKIILLNHVKEISKLKYESELKLEESLIKQSSQMQAVFSFMSVAIFIAVTVSNRGDISLKFFLAAISCIMVFLLVSLITASLAQQRKKQNAFPDVYDLEKFANDNWEDTMKESQRLKQWIDLVAKVQKEKAKLNNKRINYIRFSMGSFYGAIISIIFWFIIRVIRIL